MCVCVCSWRRVVCGMSIMTSMCSFMKYQGHGSKLSPSFKMTKLGGFKGRSLQKRASLAVSVQPLLMVPLFAEMFELPWS